MIKTTNMLLEELRDYANPKAKLSRMVKQGQCFPVTRGVYETDRNVPAYLLAGSIYGPSYISFEYALSYYGMIPEAVYTVTCATFEKKKKKKYETIFGGISSGNPAGSGRGVFLSDCGTRKSNLRSALCYASGKEYQRTGRFAERRSSD